MRKVIAGVLLMVTIMGALTGCGTKTECDFCGEEKRCETQTIFGEKIHYCKDCKDAINSIF